MSDESSNMFVVNVYVATSSRELDRYTRFVSELSKLPGIRLTQDWSRNIRLAQNLGFTSDEQLSDAVAHQVYATCKRGITDSDIFVLLVPTTPTRGAWWECGLADGHSLMVSSGNPGSAFRSAFHKTFDTDEDLLLWLGEISSWNAKLAGLD